MTPDEYQDFVIDCIFRLRKEANTMPPWKRDENLRVSYEMANELSSEGYERYMERVIND